MLNIKLLPNKVNEINYFRKENQGCTLFSMSDKKTTVIICRLVDFEIDQDFCVDDKTINMIKLLNPTDITIKDGTFFIKAKKGKYKAKLMKNQLKNIDIENKYSINVNMNRLAIAKTYCSDNESKMALNGVNVNEYGDIVATDSYTCFRYLNKNAERTTDKPLNITIPREFIDFICKEIRW